MTKARLFFSLLMVSPLALTALLPPDGEAPPAMSAATAAARAEAGPRAREASFSKPADACAESAEGAGPACRGAAAKAKTKL